MSFFSKCIDSDIRIILTDKGIGTYLPYLRYAAWEGEQKSNKLFAKGFDLAKITEIWLFEPNLYADRFIVPINKISIDDFYTVCLHNKIVTQEFKKLFNISSNNDFDYDIL